MKIKKIAARCTERRQAIIFDAIDNSAKKVCDRCEWMFMERWPKGVTALRCGADGPHRGHVTETYPEGCHAFVRDRPSPVWCTQFREKRKA